MEQKVTIGQIVHYVSYGTPGGEYPKACSPAIITNIHRSRSVDLAVLNPSGLFFDRDNPWSPPHEGPSVGTWHHAEECS